MKIKISDLMTGEFQPKADRPLDEVRLPVQAGLWRI